MKTNITFILPTRNRRQWIRRAVDSCLACENNSIQPHVIVIDGRSTDGSFEELQKIYNLEVRVKLIQQEKGKSSFMEACFQGVELTESFFVTFMYDDDQISPYFKDMFQKLIDEKGSFIAGYGAICSVEKFYLFDQIKNYETYKSHQILMSYFGVSTVQSGPLPVSPICCITTKESLIEWRKEVSNFANATELRRYFMLKRNIGPDLMVYLLTFLRDSLSSITITPQIVAQFSSHSTSMTILANSFELRVGYWLARVWAFEKLTLKNSEKNITTSGVYLFCFGIRLILLKLMKLDITWTKEIAKETIGIGKKTFSSGTLKNIFLSFNRLITNRVKNRKIETKKNYETAAQKSC